MLHAYIVLGKIKKIIQALQAIFSRFLATEFTILTELLLGTTQVAFF